MKAIRIIIGLYLLGQSVLFSQSFQEYVVSLNPNNSVYTCITSGFGSMTVMTNTAYDRDNRHLYFQGKNSSSGWNLYCVNTQSGAVINQFNLFTTGSPFVSHMYYDHVTDTLYAIYSTASFPTYYLLAWIDVTSGALNLKDTLSFLSYADGAESTFDEANNCFVLIGMDTATNYRLYTINAASGNVIHSPLLGNWLPKNLTFNNTDGNLYAYVDSSTWVNPYLCTINQTTAVRNQLVALPDMGVSSRKTVAIDESASRFIYVATNGMVDSIYVVDVLAQTITSRHLYPYDPTGSFGTEENVLGYWFDETAQTIYGIHWGLGAGEQFLVEEDLGNVLVYPNPSPDKITISANGEIQILEILNSQSQTIHRIYPYSNHINLDLSSEPAGTYFIRILNGSKISTRKVVIE